MRICVLRRATTGSIDRRIPFVGAPRTSRAGKSLCARGNDTTLPIRNNVTLVPAGRGRGDYSVF